jgi:aspartyl protease family protein
MAESSGPSSLFVSLAAFAIIAGSTAYGLKHRDQIYRTVTEFKSKKVAVQSPEKAAQAGDESTGQSSSGDVELKANPNGHFETDAEINGRTVTVLVDTGATMVSMTYEDAERSGIYLRSSDFTRQTQTANGIAKVAPVTISEISIGGITVRNITGSVSEQGKLKQTLLGMSFLSRLSRVEMRSKSLILHE